MSALPFRTRVAVVGGGLAGLLLAALLHRARIECVVLERRKRGAVRPPGGAAILEPGLTDMLRAAGVGARLGREGVVHDGFSLAWGTETLRIDLRGLTGGRTVTIYDEAQLWLDLADILEEAGVPVIHGAQAMALHGIDGRMPSVSYRLGGATQVLECDVVAGCDGWGGICRQAIPSVARQTARRAEPVGWLGVLVQAPPLGEEFLYARHPRGFALCAPLGAARSSYALQCAAGDRAEDWPDERVFAELAARLPPPVTARLTRGPCTGKRLAPFRSRILEPLRHGQLFLLGDAAHRLPPAGGKDLNLAAFDALHLSRALAAHYEDKDDQLLDAYSAAVLARIREAERFAWRMTAMLQGSAADGGCGGDAALDRLARSKEAQAVLARGYVGSPFFSVAPWP